MTQIMFETFNVPAQYVGIAPVMSLYASGRTSGYMLDIGHGCTCTVPVYEGYALPHAISGKNAITGGQMTDYLCKLLEETKLFSAQTSVEREIVKRIKEKYCYMAIDYEEESQKKFCFPQVVVSGYLRDINQSNKTPIDIENMCGKYWGESDIIGCTKTYEMPDGKKLEIGPQRFQCAEILFQPNLSGRESPGIHEIMYYSIMKCDVDIRRYLYSDIILAGGGTMIPGLDVRLQKEI
eukprot:283814_1